MPIVINEVEIQVDDAPAAQAGGGGGGGDEQTPPPQSSKMKPEGFAAAMRVGRDRMERVRAD